VPRLQHFAFNALSEFSGSPIMAIKRRCTSVTSHALFLWHSIVWYICLEFTGLAVFINSICLGQDAKEEGVVELTNSIGMKLVLIRKGTFIMGSPEEELGRDKFGRDRNETQHSVTISRDFFLCITEVTQGQYEKVMGTNPSIFQGEKASWTLGKKGKPVDTSSFPVDFVSWYDAVDFCERLSELPEEIAAERQYRLPTEAEWEYACRAGSKTSYCFGDGLDTLGQFAWYTVDPEEYKNLPRKHKVAELKPNPWGLFDMHGNVQEWCSDTPEPFSAQAVVDPTRASEGADRVLRGGSYGHEAHDCRSAKRSVMPATIRSSLIGFRVVLNAPTEGTQD
jgi:formylglycine-generating enzyme required for sulfatase activity